MIETQIYDNILPKQTEQRFSEYTKGGNFGWVDYNHVATSGAYFKGLTVNPLDTVQVPSDSLIKLVYYNNFKESKIFDDTFYQLALSVLDEYQRLSGDTVEAVMRVKVNNQTKNHLPGWHDNCCNEIHVDNFEEHKTIIYYLNDSDGDTFLFDKIWNSEQFEYDVKVEQRVTPKLGRMVAFNGLRFHAPSNPMFHPRRYIMNINFV